jgi:hypothetical protein
MKPIATAALSLGLVFTAPAHAQEDPDRCVEKVPQGYTVSYPAKVMSFVWNGVEHPVQHTRDTRKGFQESQQLLSSAGITIENRTEGRVLVSPALPTPHPIAFSGLSALRTNTGTLVGTDAGEWGGELVFIPQAGAAQTLVKQNVATIFRLGDADYALTGLAHLILNDGALWRIDTRGATARADRLADLPGGSPRAWTHVEGKALLVATEKAFAILPDGRIEPATHTRECVGLNRLNE